MWRSANVAYGNLTSADEDLLLDQVHASPGLASGEGERVVLQKVPGIVEAEKELL